jgi:hypothetical protein
VSEVADVDFPPGEREMLLREVRDHLPAFLHRGATEQHDPAGDVRELLNLQPGDLERVIAVHECLHPDVLAFGEALREGLRHPIAASIRPPQLSQGVRGSVDWSATIARRALEAGNPSLFVVRPAQRQLDTPENRALAWLLQRLSAAVSTAAIEGAAGAADEGGEENEARGWADRIGLLRSQLQATRRVQWLRDVAAEAPSAHTLKRLRAARSNFYARTVAAALDAVLRFTRADEEALAEALAERYFRPRETWRLFEVAVALRLARAFAAQSPRRRVARLLVGGGRTAFARYWFADGAEVALLYQAWPRQAGRSLLREVGDRHRLRGGGSRPDIFIVCSGPRPDAIVLELKATYSPSYLGSGLSQLLGYIGEHPELWVKRPAGWLVAPRSDAFEDCPPDEGAPLWMVSAERVGEAAVERLLARPPTAPG